MTQNQFKKYFFYRLSTKSMCYEMRYAEAAYEFFLSQIRTSTKAVSHKYLVNYFA